MAEPGVAELSLLFRANLQRWRPRRSLAWTELGNFRWPHLWKQRQAVRINRHNAPTNWQALAVQGSQGALAGMGSPLGRCQLRGGDEHTVVSAQNAESPTSSDCCKLGTAIALPRHCVAFTQSRCDRWHLQFTGSYAPRSVTCQGHHDPVHVALSGQRSSRHQHGRQQQPGDCRPALPDPIDRFACHETSSKPEKSMPLEVWERRVMHSTRTARRKLLPDLRTRLSSVGKWQTLGRWVPARQPA